jgi:hypothetical protein
MINREMLEETFGEENINKVITAYKWDENYFDEKFKEQVGCFIHNREEHYKGEIELYYSKHPNISENDVDIEIKKKEIVYKAILIEKENYKQNIIPDELQKYTFHYLTVPIKDIDSKNILSIIKK